MLEVITPSVQTTIQDQGRSGWQAFGVPPSGPMDAFAFRAANLLIGNPLQAAMLEIGYSSAAFTATEDCLIAATGAGFSLFINEQPFRFWTSIYVRKNSLIQIKKTGAGNWAYLALHGGIQTQPMLGSCSTHLASGLGAGLITAGQLIKLNTATTSLLKMAARHLPESARPNYSENLIIKTIAGPQAQWFSKESQQQFYLSEYRISPDSNRMGYRLIGDAIKASQPRELISEGMARGCIQIPAGGMPIVMQADHPTTGGYPKIAAVIAADQPLLAQAPVTSGLIKFLAVSVEQAQNEFREQMIRLSKNIQQTEDESDLYGY